MNNMTKKTNDNDNNNLYYLAASTTNTKIFNRIIEENTNFIDRKAIVIFLTGMLIGLITGFIGGLLV